MTVSGLRLRRRFRKSVRLCGYSGCMDQHLLIAPAVRPARWWARWVLLGAVIAGILAMHVLSEPEGFEGHSMPAGMVMGAEMAAVVDVPVVPAMAMAGTGVDTRLPTMQLAAGAVAANVVPPAPGGMSGMTCCILFLLTGAGVVLLALRLRVTRRQPDQPQASDALQLFWQRRRAGPLPVPAPRILLCVLRV